MSFKVSYRTVFRNEYKEEFFDHECFAKDFFLELKKNKLVNKVELVKTKKINSNELVDFLTYKSWKAQIELYNMRFEDARKLYENAKSYEKIYIEENKK